MMSGKPEQQPIQNVVVYVSTGDNFAQSYSVGQQNVAFQHPQSGGFASATPLTCKKSGLKAEFVNGSPNPGGLYTPPSVQSNGYPGTSLAYGGSSTGILKNLGAGQHMCGHIESLSAGEDQQQICSYASPAHPRICAGTTFIEKGARGAPTGADADVIQGNYVAAVTVDRGTGDVGPRGFVTLCGESSPTTPGALVPPGPRASSRCDSARSEAAESSCSSLSSDGQQEASAAPNPMIQGPSGAHHHPPVVCRTGSVALAAGQILLQGGPPHGIAQLTSSSASGQAGLHFTSPQAQHHSQTPHPEAVQSYIACPGGGVVLGNQTVVLNGQQTLGGAAGHHAGQQAIGNLVLTMTVPQLVPTGALASGGQVLQAFTTVGSLASTGPLAPPTVTLAHGGGGSINSQPLLSVHPSIATPPVGVTAPVVVNPSVAESTTSTPGGISIPFGWKRLLSTSGSIVYV
ncbi:mucin-19-like, partial [Hetaerina americana]